MFLKFVKYHISTISDFISILECRGFIRELDYDLRNFLQLEPAKLYFYLWRSFEWRQRPMSLFTFNFLRLFSVEPYLFFNNSMLIQMNIFLSQLFTFLPFLTLPWLINRIQSTRWSDHLSSLLIVSQVSSFHVSCAIWRVEECGVDIFAWFSRCKLHWPLLARRQSMKWDLFSLTFEIFMELSLLYSWRCRAIKQLSVYKIF